MGILPEKPKKLIPGKYIVLQEWRYSCILMRRHRNISILIDRVFINAMTYLMSSCLRSSTWCWSSAENCLPKNWSYPICRPFSRHSLLQSIILYERTIYEFDKCTRFNISYKDLFQLDKMSVSAPMSVLWCRDKSIIFADIIRICFNMFVCLFVCLSIINDGM